MGSCGRLGCFRVMDGVKCVMLCVCLNWMKGTVWDCRLGCDLWGGMGCGRL